MWKFPVLNWPATIERIDNRLFYQGVGMGKYVDSALLPGEEVVSEARPHWAMFVGPALVILLGIAAGEAGTIFYVLGGIWGAFRVLVYLTTEMALTNKRVIAKSGIIRRNVIDVSNSKIEGVTYNQGIIGRIFGYGSVLIRGTGVGQVPVPFIGQPEHFKHEVGRILHA
jgi:hypothetical protein